MNVLLNAQDARRNIGARPLNEVWCPICKSLNNHWIWTCPNRRCEICNEVHLTSQCPILNACQWCGSVTHTSYRCNSANGRLLHAGVLRRCFRCNRKGHIAANCTASSRWIRPKYGRFRYGRRRRRRRRRRR
jgi:hypothetical protein